MDISQSLGIQRCVQLRDIQSYARSSCSILHVKQAIRSTSAHFGSLLVVQYMSCSLDVEEILTVQFQVLDFLGMVFLWPRLFQAEPCTQEYDEMTE
jgi:hypothetical protein